jgi:hypothetical protein
MSRSEQEILALQQQILQSYQTVLSGSTTGGQAGQKIAVRLDTLINGSNTISATAWTTCPPGDCIVARDEQGNWYALSRGSATRVRQDVRSRKYRQQSNPQLTYPFKVVFSVVEDGVRKFYVGGNRSNAKLLFEIPE